MQHLSLLVYFIAARKKCIPNSVLYSIKMFMKKYLNTLIKSFNHASSSRAATFRDCSEEV